MYASCQDAIWLVECGLGECSSRYTGRSSASVEHLCKFHAEQWIAENKHNPPARVNSIFQIRNLSRIRLSGFPIAANPGEIATRWSRNGKKEKKGVSERWGEKGQDTAGTVRNRLT